MRHFRLSSLWSVLNDSADFTALTIFEQFKKETTTNAVERVLKKLAESKAKEILAVSH